MILAYTVFAGISDALLSGSLEALVYDSYKQDKNEGEIAKAFSTNSFWYQIALVIGTLSGGFLYQIWYQLPFILHGTCLAIATFLSFGFIEPKIDSEHFTLRNYLKQMRDGTKEAFRHPQVARLSIYYVIVAGISWSCTLYFNNYMFVALGFNNLQRGLLEGGLRLINILVLTKIISSSGFFSKRNTILFFPVILALSLAPGIFLKGFWALPFVGGAMITTTTRFVILSKFMNDEFSSKYRATAISSLSMLTGIVFSVITIGSGPIMQYGGGVKTMYTLLGVASIIIVAPLSYIVLKSYSRK